MCGLILTMLVFFFSGGASNQYGALYKRDTKACAPYALLKASQRLGGSEVSSDVERLFYRARDGSSMGAMDMDTALSRAMEAGLINEASELASVLDIIPALEWGEVVLTLPVYSGGLPSQFWATEGRYEGQHAILCTEYKNGLFTLLNSYGPAWGSGGRVWLWKRDLELMYEAGTARAWTIQ